MFNSTTTKNLPQTRIVTRFGIDETSIDTLAVQAAGESRDAVRGLVVPGKGIFQYESATVTNGRIFPDRNKNLPKDEINYFDGEEWSYVIPETSLLNFSSLKIDQNSLSWGDSISSDRDEIDYIKVGKQVELTFKKGDLTRTKKIYVDVTVPILMWTETSIRVKRLIGNYFSAASPTCEDFGGFDMGEEIPANQIDCENGFAVVPVTYEMGSSAPNNEEKIVSSINGLHCRKCNCCAICEDFYNSFQTLQQATQVRNSEFDGYRIIQKIYNSGSVGQNLNVACENITCYSIVLPQVPY